MKYAEVVWQDAHGGGNPWMPLEALAAVASVPKRMVSVGQVVTDDEDGMVLVLSHDEQGETCDAYIFIPAACITSKSELRRKGSK